MTLQEWTAYLPYDITVYGASELWTLKGIDPIGSVSPDSFLILENGAGLYDGASTLEFSPVLRPLSDLTKTITVEGYNDGKEFIPNHHPYFKLFVEADLEYFIDHCPTWTDWAQLSLLLSWHFDVFGLIEKGEAIDINTLK